MGTVILLTCTMYKALAGGTLCDRWSIVMVLTKDFIKKNNILAHEPWNYPSKTAAP